MAGAVAGRPAGKGRLSAPSPALSAEEYGFATLPPGIACPPGLTPLATFAEEEGLALVASVAELQRHGLVHQPGWARISLGLYSALDGVGLTATVSTALAKAGISCNMIAAYHHDHLFVPWGQREEALGLIRPLSI